MTPLRFAVAFLAVPTALAAQVTPEQFTAIKEQGLAKSQVMAFLDHLVNRIGPRLTSSDNLTDAAEWARDTFQSFGIADAHLEQWGTFPVGFNRGPWWGRMTKPEKKELVCNTNAWTAGTKRPSRGPLLLSPKDADALAAMKGKLANVWLLDPPGELFDALQAAVVEEGGFGFVGAPGNDDDRLLTDGNPGVTWEDLPKVPFVRLRRDAYREVRGLLDDGKEVEVEFDVRNHFKKGPIPLYNVIADIPGTEHPDEFVVVSGHLDSWDGATGATDNGTGTATTIEAARILTAIGAKPKRTIRFMLWSGEEQGLLGSRAWTAAHKEELAKYSACLVHDGGTNYVSGIAGMEEMRPQLETVFAPVMELDPKMPFRIRDIDMFMPIGSDHESFWRRGVPGFFWDQSGRASYPHTHHTQYDTFDAAVPEYQMHSSVVIATGALGLANLPELLTRENMKVWRGPGGGPAPGQRLLGVNLGEDTGLVVTGVAEDGIAEKVGIKPGDRIVRMGDKEVAKLEELRAAMRDGPAKTTVTVKRAGKELSFDVQFAQ
jgi:hypothetical protein